MSRKPSGIPLPMTSFFCGRRSQHPAAASWTSDETSSHCTSCDRPFTYLVRRHHCRACGSLVCSRCSGKFEHLPQYGYSLLHPVRVCQICASRKHDIIQLEREMFVLCKKSQFRRRAHSDCGTFLVDFAAKLRLSKRTEGFNENLLVYCVKEFEQLFMSVYVPLDEYLCSVLRKDFEQVDGEVDRALEKAMEVLRSWKNLENDIPGASAKSFLGKVELVERWRYPREVDESDRGFKLHKVVSSPCLTEAQASFHRHPLGPSNHVLGQQPFLLPQPSPRVRRHKSHDEY